jgi:hypothetical protein
VNFLTKSDSNGRQELCDHNEERRHVFANLEEQLLEETPTTRLSIRNCVQPARLLV